jgi:hypothetical protein
MARYTTSSHDATTALLYRLLYILLLFTDSLPAPSFLVAARARAANLALVRLDHFASVLFFPIQMIFYEITSGLCLLGGKL